MMGTLINRYANGSYDTVDDATGTGVRTRADGTTRPMTDGEIANVLNVDTPLAKIAKRLDKVRAIATATDSTELSAIADGASALTNAQQIRHLGKELRGAQRDIQMVARVNVWMIKALLDLGEDDLT